MLFRIFLLSILTLFSIAVNADMVLVGGASGRQGNAVIDELLSRGYSIRCLTRKPDSKKAKRIVDRCSELVEGNYSDLGSLQSAMKGITKVFFYSGFSRNEVAEGRNVIAAAKASDIKHLIYSSGAAAEPEKGIPSASKMQVEIDIIASGIAYTVLRPVAFMENFDRQQQLTLEKGIFESRGPERIVSFISIRDIGFFIGEAFDHPDEWLYKAVNIASDRMTIREYVDTFSRVMNADITYNRMPLDDYLATFPKPLRPLFKWYDEVGYDADVDEFRARYPNLITLDNYLMTTGWKDYSR
jgi:uncharacterized protein YbjT (DUF2867 family)